MTAIVDIASRAYARGLRSLSKWPWARADTKVYPFEQFARLWEGAIEREAGELTAADFSAVMAEMRTKWNYTPPPECTSRTQYLSECWPRGVGRLPDMDTAEMLAFVTRGD